MIRRLPRRRLRSRWHQLRAAFHAGRAEWHRSNVVWWRALASALDPGEDGR